MTDGPRNPRPKSSRPPGAGARSPRRPKRPEEGGKKPTSKFSGRQAPAEGRAKLAPFNPKSKPSAKRPRPPRREISEANQEPVLLQIQFKPPGRPRVQGVPDPLNLWAPLPEKMKWESRPAKAAERPAPPSPPEERARALPPAGSGGDRPRRPAPDRPYEKRSSDRPEKPRYERREGGKPPYKAPSDRPRSRGSNERPARPYGDRPSRPYSDRTSGERPARPPSDRPSRPSSDRPSRPYSDPTSKDRPARPPSDRPSRPHPDRTGDRPARPSSGDRPSRPPSARPQRRSDSDRPAARSSSNERRPFRPTSDRASTHPADRRPEGRPAPVVDPATGKKFDEKRPRDTRVGQGNKAEPKRRLTAEESFELPKPWIHEITELARPGTAPKVAESISKALQHFADEEYEESARLAAEAKASATRSPRITELLGLALYHSGEWKEALSELLTFRRLTVSVEHNHVIADLYRAVGRPDRALETTAEVSQADVTPETWVETMIVAAGALADKGDLNRAITMLARADPGTGPVETYFLRHWYARADLLERAGRRDEARNLWRKIVAEDPAFFDAEERLASI